MGTRLGSVSRRHEPSVAHVLGEELNSIVGVLGSKESLFSEISIVPCWSSAGWLSLRTPPPEPRAKSARRATALPAALLALRHAHRGRETRPVNGCGPVRRGCDVLTEQAGLEHQHHHGKVAD